MERQRKARSIGRMLNFFKSGLTKETYNQILKTIRAMSSTEHSLSFMPSCEKKMAMTTGLTA